MIIPAHPSDRQPDAALAPPAGLHAQPEPPLTTSRPPAEIFASVVASVRSVVLADAETIGLAVACVTAGGHLLVEDLPGLGKTTLAKALARSLGLTFRRVQFTADLLPADITGAMVLDPETHRPGFRPGPVFTNILMADELNRASPRTQSALLEAMEEQQVTVDGHTAALPHPFLVIATQNPYDAAGTSPLPHGQRDRFLVRLALGYPPRREEDRLLADAEHSRRVAALPAALQPVELAALMGAAAGAHVAPAVRGYVLDLVEATRRHPSVRVGASPRGALALLRAARAVAVAAGRDFVVPDDVQAAAVPVLAHRLLIDARSDAAGDGPAPVVEEIVRVLPVPVAPGPPATGR
ncbi:MAG: AAA family ATPase [Acidimicrobiales bacterium]